MEELSFKIVKMLGAHDEVIERSSNFIIARAAYDTAVALWNGDDIELRQGTRVLNKSKPESA